LSEKFLSLQYTVYVTYRSAVLDQHYLKIDDHHMRAIRASLVT